MGPLDASQRNLTVLEDIELSRIPAEGLSFEEPAPQAWLQETLQPLKGAAPETAHIVSGVGDVALVVVPLCPIVQLPPFRLTGHLRCPLEVPCVRCLETVAFTQDVKIDQVLFWADSEEAEAPESVYEGEKLPLPLVVREQLLLSLNAYPSCIEVEACDKRTAKMLQEANRPALEAENAVDPRWAALGALQTDE